MKIRILSIACVTTAAALLAACTAVYKNSDACEQLMRSKLAATSPDTLKIAHTGAAIDGSRVVVEGSIEHVMTASEVAAASAAAAAASAAKLANAPHPASDARAASAVEGASSVAAASGVTAGAASAASAASASVAASGGEAASLKPAKPKKINTAAAAECTFHGSALSVFSWLAPAKFATPPDGAASEAAE
ncbi:hypothetical protein DSC91_004056 [Paraburkholderia caffeinilytica]|uniref:Lipoprotein n=1 Tax=Paraburkholderia caffeinilytica TaxID=1761016 RepID=A0ABQ1L9J7_9BURK|nr:hypothetical protein [Paraburkholderia caffeinilytica]AXL51403.1 hypothetical protein DSC91_004056 [Paraburkholderia caffeinilytica]GGC21560.1 hypothetical protein GCM10011400_04910 [Paraburkholderia caffeinilytica]CAB3777985.1 hypothetical protein LMG28690_00577 [Paraburkholderia caffeinilytica]